MAWRIRAVSSHVELPDELQAQLPFCAEAQPRAGEYALMNRHRDIVREWQFEYDAVATPIFRYVGDTVCDRFLRRTNRDALTVKHDFACVGGREAEQNSGQFGASRANQSS